MKNQCSHEPSFRNNGLLVLKRVQHNVEKFTASPFERNFIKKGGQQNIEHFSHVSAPHQFSGIGMFVTRAKKPHFTKEILRNDSLFSCAPNSGLFSPLGRPAPSLVEEHVAVTVILFLRLARQHRLVVVIVPILPVHVPRVRSVMSRRGAYDNQIEY